MFRGLARWRVGGLLAATAACQSIIGIEDYEIDASLDEPGITGGAGGTSGASTSGASAGEPGAGDGGEPGAGDGGEPSAASCREDRDCDDTIDCTVDRCGTAGTCIHEADHSACQPDAGECLTCRVGIGCVVGPVVMKELLLDPAFDVAASDWSEDSDGGDLIRTDASAYSTPRLAQLGPAPEGVAEEYADLYQFVSIPVGTQSLTLSGYYQLVPGTRRPAKDLVVAALYESGVEDYALLWSSWEGTDPAQSTWKAFSYTASSDELELLTGGPYSFDLLAYTADSVFRFDSLSLLATVCE